MSTGNLSLDLLLIEINSDHTQAKEIIKGKYPSLTDKEAEEISTMLRSCKDEPKEKVSLAVTAPPSFAVKAKSTKNTVETLIKNATKSLLITSYSLSDYFYDLVEVIIYKSQSGVFVKFFVNDIGKQKNFDKLIRYKGHFLKIYNYTSRTDGMAALHAKVISVDGWQSLITSANLSYHGQEGNIELGTLIQSQPIAKQIENVFTQLIFSKVFVEI